MIDTPQRVLCLIAHPDDLEPQAGGTIARLVAAGSEVKVVTAVVPNLAKDGTIIEGHQDERYDEALAATDTLGVIDHEVLWLSPFELAHDQHHVMLFDQIAQTFQPDLIIGHGEIDTQQDHVTMAHIAHTLARKNRVGLWQLAHSFPAGWMPQRPTGNLFVDVTRWHEVKMKAVAKYRSQMLRYPDWLEGIEARDRYLGWMINQEGTHSTRFAEAFVVQKMVWDMKERG